jgi:hypothetical protein
MRRWRYIGAGVLAGAALTGSLAAALDSPSKHTGAAGGTRQAQRETESGVELRARERELETLAAKRAQRAAEKARLNAAEPVS